MVYLKVGTKNTFLQKFKKGGIPKDIYVSYNNCYRNLIKLSKEKEFSDKLKGAGNNGKKKWECLKDELQITKLREGVKEIKQADRRITDNKKVAECFKTHFETCATTLVNSLPDGGQLDLKNIKKGAEWSFKHTTVYELLTMIKVMENKNSCGHDLLSNRMIKNEKVWFATTLTTLINESLTEGLFPEVLKKAVVIPIFKKGDATNLNNYRPISLLPVMSKLFEKVLNKQITQVLDINGYIDDDQYGFRMQHSTEDAIVKFVDTIEKGLGENKHVVSISVDVSKAFDSCNHNIILAKMKQTGLNEQGISIMRSYLKDRVQMVQVNGINGGEFIINIGVGQGTILGPTIFKIYIMDLHKVTTLKCIKFADDSNFIGIANTSTLLERMVNTELSKIYDWFLNNRLTIHPDKSRYMIHSKKKDIILNLGHTAIQRVGNGLQEESVRFLGLYIDENLNWKEHCKKVISKINKGGYLLWRHKRKLSTGTKKLIYESFVRCHLLYGLIVWGPVGVKHENLKKTLQRIYNKFGKRYEHTNRRLFENNILNLQDELALTEKCWVWKWSQKKLPNGVTHILIKRNMALRGNRFILKRHWLPRSISYRLSKRAITDYGMLQEYTSKKQTVCKEKQKFINKYNCQCEIRNCFICLNRTLQ